MNKVNGPKNNVLSFNQPAEFFVKKAEKQFDAGNFLEALSLYRQVLDMDPSNTEYLLSISQVYSEMGLYSESNDVLHKIIRHGNMPTECLFALGCNYIGMKKYHLADDVFEQYLEIDPNGEYADDIDEIFDLYDDDYDDIVLHDVSRSILVENAYRGKDYLDRGEYKKAIQCLKDVTEQDHTMVSAANNLALSYFFEGDNTKAIETSEKVLASQPSNLHACCNLAMFYAEAGEQKTASKYLSALETIKDIAPHDMHKVALTYCELGIHDKAYLWFTRLVAFQPYDTRILHFCGLSAYNNGRYAEAQACFDKILKIDPVNSLAVYYKQRTEHAKQNGGGAPLEYVYQVQFEEIKRRIKYLNECLKQQDSSLLDMWRTDKKFQSIILWGLHYGDVYIKKIVLEIMSVFADKKVENEFRDYLLKSAEPDEIKNDVFLYLKRMGAKEPYVAYIKGAIAEVRVGNVSEDIEQLPKPYTDALAKFIPKAQSAKRENLITSGIEALVTIAKNDSSNGEWIKSPAAFAAALEYYVCSLLRIEDMPTKKQLIKKYETSLVTFNRYLARIVENKLMDEDNAD